MSLFTDTNSEPSVLRHNCISERMGKEMTQSEMYAFAVELLVGLYEKSGMIILDINRIYQHEYPNIVMKSRNGVYYYVVVETAEFPQKVKLTNLAIYSDVKALAQRKNAVPVFAGISFLNADRGMEEHKMICGEHYFAVFEGLEKL